MIENYRCFPQKLVENSLFLSEVLKRSFTYNPFARFLVYYEKGEAIAYLLYSHIYERMEIEQLEVFKGYRQQGVATKLLKYLLDMALKEGVTNITLEVRQDNLAAYHLYQNCGFLEVARRSGYYHGIDGILMEKQVKD